MAGAGNPGMAQKPGGMMPPQMGGMMPRSPGQMPGMAGGNMPGVAGAPPAIGQPQPYANPNAAVGNMMGAGQAPAGYQPPAQAPGGVLPGAQAPMPMGGGPMSTGMGGAMGGQQPMPGQPPMGGAMPMSGGMQQPGGAMPMAGGANMPGVAGAPPTVGQPDPYNNPNADVMAMGGAASQPLGAQPPGVQPPIGAGQPPAGGQPQGGPNVYQQSSNAYGNALGATNAAMRGPNIGQFANPFDRQAIDAAMGDIGRQQQKGINQLGASATAAGAFGGSRHGIAEGETMGQYGRAAADTASRMRQQGFNTALGAAQNQQNTMLQGAGQLGNLSNLGFGFGQQIGQNQMQQGTMQQALNQALIDAGRGQYGGYTGAPNQALNLPFAALGGANMGQGSETQSKSPGLLSIFSTLMGLG